MNLKYSTIGLFLLFGFYSRAETLTPFLESPLFAEFCDKVLVPKIPADPSSAKKPLVYLIRNPSFAQDAGFIYMGIQDVKKQNMAYTIYKAEKANPTVAAEILELKKPAVALKVNNGILWALHDRSLTRVNLQTQETQELVLSKSGALHDWDRAYDMVELNGSFYVTHGTAGLIKINPQTMKIENLIDLGLTQPNGHRSLASSLVAISDSELIIGVDNLSLPTETSKGFNGLVRVNIHTNVFKHLPYAAGVFTRFSKMSTDGNTLWVNNSGTLQYVGLQNLNVTGWVDLTFTEKSETYRAEPRGEFFVIDDNIYMCAVRHHQLSETPQIKKGISYKVQNPIN